MIYLNDSSKFYLLTVFLVIGFYSCKEKLPVIAPSVITEKTPHDTDDPAIWINFNDPDQSIVFGTDKDETNGGIYAFDLDGKIIKEKSLTGLSYPNNVDISYGFKFNDSTSIDILAFTEREKNQFRLFSIPQMTMLDKGGFRVFEKETDLERKRPMGIAFYQNQSTQKTYVIVSRKAGPQENYLHQYELYVDSLGVNSRLVRNFGAFSGKKEIEAIAVDEELGYIYYSDEDHCIRKYYADPEKGNEELACFGGSNFKRDIEGIAIVKHDDGSGFLIVSNQQANTFAIFDRQTNAYLKEINLGSVETDGCDVTTIAMGDRFPKGLFVCMTDSREFLIHDLEKLELE